MLLWNIHQSDEKQNHNNMKRIEKFIKEIVLLNDTYTTHEDN